MLTKNLLSSKKNMILIQCSVSFLLVMDFGYSKSDFRAITKNQFRNKFETASWTRTILAYIWWFFYVLWSSPYALKYHVIWQKKKKTLVQLALKKLFLQSISMILNNFWVPGQSLLVLPPLPTPFNLDIRTTLTALLYHSFS